ncbi:hypothetical protein EJD97_019654 [Solanum chilense]|uniref:Uncharacterized protein n=1 Tax=Solanum chilense TaxID=4083 RepID=A0A6N2C860_SOLCI|nr:hypothetical protein EJD97_019654 [Solanum chilense]
MNTRRIVSRRLDEEIANAGVFPGGNLVPPLEEFCNDYRAPVIPQCMMKGDIRATFLQMSHGITTQAQAVTTQEQSMTTQVNREVVPRGNKHDGTMDSFFRDLTRMNPPTSYGSKFEEDHQLFIA